MARERQRLALQADRTNNRSSWPSGDRLLVCHADARGPGHAPRPHAVCRDRRAGAAWPRQPARLHLRERVAPAGAGTGAGLRGRHRRRRPVPGRRGLRFRPGADARTHARRIRRAIFLRHYYSDHIGAIGDHNINSWAAGRGAPLEIVGPEGVEEVVAGFNRAFALDAAYRTEHGSELMPPDCVE